MLCDKQRGMFMSNTTLKVIAMIAMLLDHIARFFPEAPYALHWIGRISAPIFLFCCVIGFINTSNRKKYLIRIYFLSVIVEIMNLALGIGELRMNFIRTILITLIVIFIIEKIRIKSNNAWLYLIGFIGMQGVIFLSINTLVNLNLITDELIWLLLTVTGSAVSLDFGILFVLIGVAMFLFHNHKIKLTISFGILTAIYMLLFNTTFVIYLENGFIRHGFPLLADTSTNVMSFIFSVSRWNINPDLLFGNPQWMMLFALPFVFMYNEQKGRGLKWLFYSFYPVHIAILYLISISF